MKTQLNENIFIEGFDDQLKFIGSSCFYNDNDVDFSVIYSGKTSEIPEEIAKKCVAYDNIMGFNEFDNWVPIDKRPRDYDKSRRLNTAKESILSACNQPYCIIYKLK